MRQRCSNPKYHAYARYGGRGIQVCDRWRNSNRRCAILNALCNNQEIAIADPATTSSALHGVAHALARRPWVALERLAGAGRSPAYAFLATLP